MIREKNFKKVALHQISKIQQNLSNQQFQRFSIAYQNKSPIEIPSVRHSLENPQVKQNPRNVDAPLPIKDREILLQKKRQEYDLGLEIFKLKKEMGLGSNREHGGQRLSNKHD